MPAITTNQVIAIHAALSARGLDDAEYRAILERRFGVRTCKELTRAEGTELLATLGRPLPPRKPRRPRAAPAPLPANAVALPTPAQADLIRDLCERIVWRKPDGAALWMLASFGWRRPRTMAEAGQAIEALKAMAQRAGKWR